MGFTGLLWALFVPVVSTYAVLHFKGASLGSCGAGSALSVYFRDRVSITDINRATQTHTVKQLLWPIQVHVM